MNAEVEFIKLPISKNFKDFKEMGEMMVEKTGSCPPAILFFKTKETICLGLENFSDNTRDAYLEFFRTMVQSEKIPRYVWMASVEVMPAIASEQKPNKSEELIIADYKLGSVKRVFLPYRKENNQIVWGKEKVSTNLELADRWNFYLEDTFEEKISLHTIADKSIKFITAAEAKGKIKENRRFIQSALTIYYNEHGDTCFKIIYGDETIYSADIEGKTTSIDQKAFEEYRQKYKFTKKETGETKAEIFECDGKTFAVINPPPDDEICQRCGRKSEELEKTFRNLDGINRASWECPNCIDEDTIF